MLAELLSGMRVLRLRMLNSLEPLGILLRRSDARIFSMLGNELHEGVSLAECWESLRDAETRRGHMLDSLSEGDLAILNDFFRSLGCSGREEQNRLFADCVLRMEEAQAGARKLLADASRSFTALGALVGAAICILIL